MLHGGLEELETAPPGPARDCPEVAGLAGFADMLDVQVVRKTKGSVDQVQWTCGVPASKMARAQHADFILRKGKAR